MRRFKEAVKRDIIGTLFFCFLLGTGFIWLGSAYDWLQMTDGEKINGTVLWLTALAIFWYAYETYQLKKSTADQVEIQEEIMLNEFLPILVPVRKGPRAVLRNNDLSKLCIRNLGKGPAKYVEIYFGSVKIDMNSSLAGGEEESVKIEATTQQALRQILVDSPASLKMRITYKDIYSRRFQTVNILWDKTGPGQTYTLRQGAWDFKRLTNNSSKP